MSRAPAGKGSCPGQLHEDVPDKGTVALGEARATQTHPAGAEKGREDGLWLVFGLGMGELALPQGIPAPPAQPILPACPCWSSPLAWIVPE